MSEIIFIILGWLFGLLSPRIIDAIQSNHERKHFLSAITTEAKDLQYRLARTSYTIAQKEGLVSRENLIWFKSILLSYDGTEPKESFISLIDVVLNSESDLELQALNEYGNDFQKAISLKNYSASFLTSNIEKLHTLPLDFQVLTHEFLNVLSIVNQEIATAIKYHDMTFDSSLTEENYNLIVKNLHESYGHVSLQSRRASEKLQKLCSYTL